MRELLYPFTDRYFFDGMIVGSTIAIIIFTLMLSFVSKNWCWSNIFAIFCFVFIFIIALKEASKMYEEKK